jgi:hypothetical protein
LKHLYKLLTDFWSHRTIFTVEFATFRKQKIQKNGPRVCKISLKIFYQNCGLKG